MPPIVLWGATGQARVLAEFLPALGYDVVALIDRDPAVAPFLPGVPLLRGWDELQAWRTTQGAELCALVAVGGSHGRERLALQTQLAAAGYRLPAVAHPRAFVAAGATLGAGTQILALAAVCAAERVGAGCIVNTGARIEHECVIGDGAHVAPGATLGGAVEVGSCAYVGIGATVLPRLTIGADAIVGGGAVVVRDIPARSVAFGNPARVRRTIV